jgi:NAD(P)-dependent dehydrogenase (short-subunit alcohol dehydrogenase family)
MMSPNESSLLGKTIVVTGATSGIGRVTAAALAKLGAVVYCVGRDSQRTQDTVAAIQKESANPQVYGLLADLASFRQIRNLADEIRQRTPCLDVLVNNAGALFLQRKLSQDGVELSFALNHLAYFLLTNLLLDLLKSTAPEAGEARIVNVSSAAHMGSKIHFDDLQFQHGYRGMRVYSQSKLTNVLFTYELARRLAGSGVTTNALHPGFVASRFATNNGLLVKIGMSLMRFIAISPEEGAQTSIYLASSPEVKGVTGKYFVKCQPKRSDPASYNEDTSRRLWEVSAQMVGLEQPAAASV